MSITCTIHRGTHEIGGTCIELSSGNTRIILDIGMPLVNPDGTEFRIKDYDGLSGAELRDRKVLPCVEGLYDWETPTVDAVLISHAHQDHYGFLSHIHPDIPVYMSAGSLKLVEITAAFIGKKSPCNNTLCFSWPSCFQIGAFTIRPHLVDHSSFSAFAFEIEAEGKRIFYSGDFRDHGYLGKAMGWLYRRVSPGVDALIMEGTMLGRENGRARTESVLASEAAELCKNTPGAVLVYQSGQNLSRAVAFYKAARVSKRQCVFDVYMAHVLDEVAHSPGGEGFPDPGNLEFPDIRVWYPKRLTQMLKDKKRASIVQRHQHRKMTLEEVPKNPKKALLFVRPGMEDELASLKWLDGGTLIYSLWEGYKDQEKTRTFLNALQAQGVRVIDLHTSGHADIPTLKRMAYKLQPKCIVPVHTFHRDRYADFFPFPIAELEDGCLEL